MLLYGRHGVCLRLDMVTQRMHATCFNRESGLVLSWAVASLEDTNAQDFGKLGVFWKLRKETTLLLDVVSVERLMRTNEILRQ